MGIPDQAAVRPVPPAAGFLQIAGTGRSTSRRAAGAHQRAPAPSALQVIIRRPRTSDVVPLASASAVSPVLATVSTVVSAVFPPVATSVHSVSDHCCAAHDGCGPA
jgi:hypothetical protein